VKIVIIPAEGLRTSSVSGTETKYTDDLWHSENRNKGCC